MSSHCPSSGISQRAEDGPVAPDFSLKPLSGGTVSGSYPNHSIALTLFLTWLQEDDMTPLQQPAGDPPHTHTSREEEACRGEARSGSASPCKAKWEIQHLQPRHKTLDNSQANSEWKEALVSP